MAALVVGNVVLAGVAYGCAWLGESMAPHGEWSRRGVDAAVLMVAMVVGFAAYAGVLAKLDYPGAARLVALPERLLARRRRG